MTIPSIGPITGTAIATLAPPPGTFAKGRDFAAWVGLTPCQHSTGGKQKLGAISKLGERTLRRLLIIGSSAVVLQASKRLHGLFVGTPVFFALIASPKLDELGHRGLRATGRNPPPQFLLSLRTAGPSGVRSLVIPYFGTRGLDRDPH